MSEANATKWKRFIFSVILKLLEGISGGYEFLTSTRKCSEQFPCPNHTHNNEEMIGRASTAV